MVNWYKKQRISIRSAIITGLFAILAAIITGLFAILAAIITFLPGFLGHPITSTLVPTSTVFPQKNDLSQSPSATPKISPNDSVTNPTSTPFFSTIPTPSNILFYDGFSNSTSGWNQDGYTNGWFKILYDTWHEKTFYTWEKIGTIDGVFGIRVTVIGPFSENGFASRGIIFGSNGGNNKEPFSFSVNQKGLCKISRYYVDSEYNGWHSVVEEKINNFDSTQSYFILELQITNYRQIKGIVDGRICIDTTLEDYAPGFVGLYATPDYSSSDSGWGESFFDDFYIYRP
jgi:hypothetical protein